MGGKREKQRNRRMFGNLLGTLQKFKQDENRVKVREQKKRDVEKKIEEKTEKEKEEAKRTKNELFSEKKKQQQEIRMLQIQMTRVQEYELWEKNKRREMQHIRTNVPDQPQIFICLESIMTKPWQSTKPLFKVLKRKSKKQKERLKKS